PVFQCHSFGKQDFVLDPRVGDQAPFELLQFLENDADVERGTGLKRVVVCDFTDALHFIVVRFMFDGKLVNGILFQLIVYPRKISPSFQRAFQKPDVGEQCVLLFVYVFYKIFYKQGEHQLQVLLQLIIIGVIGPEGFDKPADVRQLVLNKNVVRVFEVLYDKVDGIVEEGQLGLLEEAGRLQLADHLFELEVPLTANLLERVSGTLIKSDAQVVQYVAMYVILVYQFADALLP